MPVKKKAPKKSDLHEVIIILDRSGSMLTIRDDMEKGLEHFVSEQAKLPGECLFTLVQFDTQAIETVFEGRSAKNVPKIEIAPRDGTPLLDAVGKTVTRMRGKKHKIILVIITDGQENSSREWSRDGVKKLLLEVQNDGWIVSYLGANVDAYGEASALGISPSSVSNYGANAAGVAAVAVSFSAAVTRKRGGQDFFYTDAEKNKMGNAGDGIKGSKI